MKSFRWRILICLVPVLASAIVVGWAVKQYRDLNGGFNLGVDLAGGTILIYEVQEPVPPNFDINEMAAALKRRIDPADLYNVTIRPVGSRRIEIILPTGAQHKVKEGGEKLTQEKVEEVKGMIARQGSLEFRILANDRDDAQAIEAARKYFVDAKKDAALRTELNALLGQGKPPPPPKNNQGGDTFTARDGSVYTYSWVKPGKDERWNLGLSDNAPIELTKLLEKGKSEKLSESEQKDVKRLSGENWEKGKVARDKDEAFSLPGVGLVYSVPFNVPQASAKEKDKKFEYFFLTRNPEKDKAVTGEYLADVSSGTDDSLTPTVNFRFDNQGANLFQELTTKNKPEGSGETGFRRHLAILVDNEIVSAPSLNAVIRDRGQISGMSDVDEVNKLVKVLKSGKLPATLKERPVSENMIGATLGADTIESGAKAVVLSFLAVLVFMMVYYRFSGMVASIALLANLLLTVAFMVLVNATFTLPGLAGLVLMLGMAVDANVLIYERLREERDRGASLALAIRNGYDRAFPTIIDTHLTSIFTAIVLYVVGNDQLKGFGISLTVGLIISLFTSLYMTRTFFDLALAKGWLTKLSMMRFMTRPNIDFMSLRYVMFTFTVIASVLGLALFLYRGEKGLDIDFTGGTAYQAQLAEPQGIEKLRELLDKQADQLKVAEVKELSPGTYEIIYDDGNGKKDIPRTVHIDESREHPGQPPSVEEVRKRASELPDYSLEMSVDNDMFTVRTSEKATELVQAEISRLLGDRLKSVNLSYKILNSVKDENKDAKTPDPKPKDAKEVAKPAEDPKLAKAVVLTFTNPRTGEPEFASPARVTTLLGLEMDKDPELKDARQQMLMAGEGSDKEGLYQTIKVVLPQPVDRAKFEAALARVKDQYNTSPQPERLENFDSQLATETQLRALYAIIASWGAILLYLWFRFGNWTFGLAAVACLVHDLCFTLGLIAVCHFIDIYVHPVAHILGLQDFKLNLAAIASLLTLVGYSVNDTIVVFDRIREVRGKNPALTPQMINDSVNQTLSRTLLTSFVTWLVVVVLYIFGGAGVHLFAFVMVVGVLVGTFSSIYVASPLLLFFGEGKHGTQRGGRPTETVAASR